MIRASIASAVLVVAVMAAVPAAAQLRVEKRAVLMQPVVLGPNQAAIIVGFRRPDSMSAGKSGTLAFARYDPAVRDMIALPRDAKKRGDTATYWVSVRSGDRKLALDHAVMVVSAGDYVLYGATPGPDGMVANSFCLGAPTFHVGAGEAVYFGDVTPYIGVKLADGTTASAMAWSSHPDDARAALVGQPGLVAAFHPASIRNNATYSCAAQTMTAYAVPGAPALPPLSDAEKAVLFAPSP